MKPIRVQRKRIKGWKMPENTIYVGRPTIWGNPYVIDLPSQQNDLYPVFLGIIVKNNKEAVEWFTKSIKIRRDEGGLRIIEALLKGKNLACWCSLDQPCHADILLEIANE